MKRVFIAAGHGGSRDPGAVSDGIIEKNINLKVALFLRDYLKDYDCDIKMSRVADTPAPTIVERCAEAAKLKADCYLDIHHNGGGGVGGEAFFWHSDKRAQEFAALTAQEFKRIGQRLRSVSGYPEGAKPSGKDGVRNFGVCRINAGNGIPAILGEYAFIDSAADRAKIDTDAKLKVEAAAYGKAIVAFLGLKAKAPAKPSVQPYAGQPVVLNGKKVYASSTAKKHASTKSGTYYYYDGVAVNGRYRITNAAKRVGKTPVWLNVTGWI